ncbi:MAG: polysaccharide deacetylase family protein [Myxococcota bacterium]
MSAIYYIGILATLLVSSGNRTISGEKGQGRHLIFTFDDGPSYKTTPLLLDYLDKLGLKAIFFVNGQRFNGRSHIVKRNREVLKEVHRRGHEIGNHTYSHPMMSEISKKKQYWQLAKTEKLIKKITGYKPCLYRPPFGQMSYHARVYLKEHNYSTLMWNLDSEDPFQRHVAKVYANVLSPLYFYKRGLVLMHDTNSWSIEAVPRIVKAIRLWNCELMARGDPIFEFGNVADFRLPGEDKYKEPDLKMIKKAYKRRIKMKKWCETIGKGDNDS